MMTMSLGILLVGLLGFLGCSGSDNDGTSTFTGEAIPVAPFGIVETPSPSYEWTPVRLATKYRLLVQDTNEVATINDSNETSIIDEWYTAEQAGCASEDGMCMVTHEIEVNGKHVFKVLACQNENCGPWSETSNFDVTAMNGPRFTDNGDQTVTDNKTMLMWDKDPTRTIGDGWNNLKSNCHELKLADYSDWRLPSIKELYSLVDKTQANPALPSDNPFKNADVMTVSWSSTEVSDDDSEAWYVDWYTGDTWHDPKYGAWVGWCVSAGH